MPSSESKDNQSTTLSVLQDELIPSPNVQHRGNDQFSEHLLTPSSYVRSPRSVNSPLPELPNAVYSPQPFLYGQRVLDSIPFVTSVTTLQEFQEDCVLTRTDSPRHTLT